MNQSKNLINWQRLQSSFVIVSCSLEIYIIGTKDIHSTFRLYRYNEMTF